MVAFEKDAALGGVPFGVLEVTYPERALWRTEDFQTMLGERLQRLRERYADYDRRTGIYGMTFFPVIRCGFSGKKP